LGHRVVSIQPPDDGPPTLWTVRGDGGYPDCQQDFTSPETAQAWIAGWKARDEEDAPPPFKLEDYDPLAKRRAIMERIVRSYGVYEWQPCAWVDYDDVSKEDADAMAEAMLEGLIQRVGH